MPDIPMQTRAQKRTHWQESPWADYGERVSLLLLFGWFVSRVAPSVEWVLMGGIQELLKD